jgi:hypothetical protein
MVCHKAAGGVWAESEKLAPVRGSQRSGQPLRWARVHDLPDFVFFDHSAHVSRNVGCFSCHGRVDQMEVVSQTHTLSMGWCLGCHRAPEPHLRPAAAITDLGWVPPDDPQAQGRALRETNSINPSTDCTACHR